MDLSTTHTHQDLTMLVDLLRRYRQLLTEQAAALRAAADGSSPKAE